MVTTSRVAYAEARAALARARREGRIDQKAHRQVIADLDHDWEKYLIVEVTEGLVRWAGALAERHALRGFDAIHLASGLLMKQRTRMEIFFSCFDERLEQAAQAEGLTTESAKRV